MYGHAPPAVIAVHGDAMASFGAMQRTADAVADQMKLQPVWVVALEIPEEKVEALCRVPTEAACDQRQAAAALLAARLADAGCAVPVLPHPPEAAPHAPHSAVLCGGWSTAARVAEAVGARHVTVWGGRGGVPAHIDTIAFIVPARRPWLGLSIPLGARAPKP